MADPDQLKSIFLAALAVPADRRAALLEERCGGDGALREQVDRLLAVGARAGGFMNSPTAEMPGPSGRAIARGSRVGSYKLLEQIGQGAFGTVYLAEQQQPFVRRVALKVLRADLVGRDVLARFEAERQALAMMDHPHIAKILDAGEDSEGRPYFAMDLVVGCSITEYCDEQRLGIRERMELFEQVCLATQHAHSRGVMHRDIKPSNILVSTRDGRPHATMIDFGIAKATQARLTEKTLATAFRAFVGTPQYMSPEQASGSLDIDTRTDVYSLGVLLYELITGQTPFADRPLEKIGLVELLRVIREVEPDRPSTRLSRLPHQEPTKDGSSLAIPSVSDTARETALGPSPEPVLGREPASATPTLEQVARFRREDPSRLAGAIRGELDWIVMKAIDKDRARRYLTASALGADVRRFLDGQPISAAPPSRTYRLRKFAQQNRVVAGLAVVSVLTLVGMVVALVFALLGQISSRKELEQKQASLNEAKAAADITREMAEKERARAEVATRVAEEARDQARREAYLANIRAAELAASRNERAILREALDGCDESLRGWEWTYLTSHADDATRTLAAGRAGVRFVVPSPDGLRALCGTQDLGLSLIDPESGSTFPFPKAALDQSMVAGGFAADGARVITISSDGNVRTWNTATMTERERLLTPGSYRVLCGAVSPNGRIVVIGCSDGSVRRVETTRDRAEERHAVLSSAVVRVAFSGDSDRIVVGAADGSVAVVDLRTGKATATSRLIDAPVTALAFAPNGKNIAASWMGGTTLLLDPATGDRVRELPTGFEINPDLAFAPDSRRLAIADGMSVRLYDVDTGLELAQFRGHDSSVTSVAFVGPATLLAGAADGKLRWFDSREVRDTRRFFGTMTSGQRSISQDGSRLVMVRGGRIEVRDTTTGRVVGDFETPGVDSGAASFTPDGKRVVVWDAGGASGKSWTGRGVVLDAWTGEIVRRLAPVEEILPNDATTGGGYHAAAFGPDGQTIAFPAPGWRCVVFDWSTKERKFTLQHEGSVNDVVYAPDGDLIATASDDGTAKLWKSSDGSLVRTLTAGPAPAPVRSLVFSRTGAVLATVSSDQTVRVWRAADGEPIGALKADDAVLSVIQITDDGTRLLVSTGEQHVRLCDAQTGTQLAEFVDDARRAAFELSPDGERIVGVGRDAVVRLRSVRDECREIMALRGHRMSPEFATFLQDGRLVSASDEDVIVWDAASATDRAARRDEADKIRELMAARYGPRLANAADALTVSADVARDASLTEPQRLAAAALVTEDIIRRHDKAAHFRKEANAIAQPAATADELRKAVQMAREARKLEPRASGHAAELAIALYRTQQFKDAASEGRDVSSLLAEELGGQELGRARPQWAGYLIMSLWKAGAKREAIHELDRFRELILKYHAQCDCSRYLLEAESVVRPEMNNMLLGVDP